MNLTWTDGRLLPPIPGQFEPGRQLPGSGALIIGNEGCIVHGSHGAGGLRIVPETKMREYKVPQKTIPRVGTSHEGDWLRACKTGRPGVELASRMEKPESVGTISHLKQGAKEN